MTSCTRCSAFLPRATPKFFSSSATMSPTVMRGFSDAYGSWKIIWICWRVRRSFSPLIEVRSTSLKYTWPDEAQRLPGRDREVDAVHRVDDAAREQASAGGEVLDQLLDPHERLFQRRVVGRRDRRLGGLRAHFNASASGFAMFFISTQHRASWPGSTSPRGGSSVKQRSMRNLQRGWNLHPAGKRPRSGGRPLIEISLSFSTSSTRGIERSSDQV